MEPDNAHLLAAERIIRSTEWLMAALTAAREVDAPGWLIGAGAVRAAVWDRLHRFEAPSPVPDIDLGFFDRHDLSPARDREVEAQLAAALPGPTWDAKNQAAVHLWYPEKFGRAVEPFESAAAAVATWPEFATCVAVRLNRDDSLTIEAPFGLDDLLGMVVRRNPARISLDQYERRLAEKRFPERWPMVRVMST